MESNMVGKTGLPIQFTTENGDGIAGPKQESTTRTPFFKVRNYWGGESQCSLFSVDHDQEVFDKLANKYFTGIYFIELSMFKDPQILIVSNQCLRAKHLYTPGEETNPWFQWIADTNPDPKLGNQSWFYKMFWTMRLKGLATGVWFDEEDEPNPVKREELNRDAKSYYARMSVFEMSFRDNPFCSKADAIDLVMSCQGEPDLLEAWVEGKHGDAGRKKRSLFSMQFNKDLHVVGSPPSGQIDVNSMTTDLLTGWDIGGVNHAAVILDKWTININGKNLPGFSVLDELVHIGEELKIAEFGQEMHKKMQAIEALTGQIYRWTNWSDDSAINVWRPNSGTFDYLDIRNATGGAITLVGVQKPSGSIGARIRLLKKLIHQNRLYVSARCHWVIRMIQNAKAGEDDKDLFDNSTNLKHIFDALTYPIFMECALEVFESNNPPQENKEANDGVILANY